MAQGPLKSRPKPTTSHKPHQPSKITKKGARTIAPKNAKLAKQAKLNKKLTGSMINDTEKMLGAKAGHLEMLGKGREKGTGGGSRGKKVRDEKFQGKSKKSERGGTGVGTG